MIFISNNILDCSFMHAAGPVAIISIFFCFLPYLDFNNSNWENAKETDPIISGLRSRYFLMVVIAAISVTIPPVLDLLANIILLNSKSKQTYFSILSVLLCNVVPLLLILSFVIPSLDSRLFICLHNANSITMIFAVSNFLCEYGRKFWRQKLLTITLTIMFISISTAPSVAYFDDHLRFWVQNGAAVLLIAGILIFFHLSYNFLRTRTSLNAGEDEALENELCCKFVIACMLIAMFGVMILQASTGFKYWTQQGTDYLVTCTLLFSIPNLAMSMVLSQLTRNRAYISQSVKQMFVRYISHEMRTPQNTAVMGLQYLRSELVKSCRDTELLGIVDEVREACEISVTILNEMLDYDKLQSGGMKLDKEEIEVQDFLETTISPFYVHASQKDITLTCNMDSLSSTSCNSLLLFITADRNKLAQVIRNLLSNALKFTPTGGFVKVVVTTVTALISTERKHSLSLPLPLPRPYFNSKAKITSSYAHAMPPTPTTTTTTTISYMLRIDVIDSGAGVSKENQKKLFKEIVQFNPGKLQSGGGSGLGLYISKGIMDLHEGSSLSITSEGEGHGCTFTVILPVKLQQPLPIPDIEEYKIDNKVTLFQKVSLSPRRNSVFNSPFSSKMDYRGSTKSISSSIAPVNEVLKPTISPLRQKEYAECQSFSYEEEESSVSSLALKVLVVDDSTSNRKMLVRLLKDKCKLIYQAVDGIDAVQQVKANMEEAEAVAATKSSNSYRYVDAPSTPSSSMAVFDVVLMDFIMPNMEGPEAARAMRDLGFTGLIIGITGNVLPADRDRFTSQGADIVLTKPVDIRDINRAFRLIHDKNKS